MTPSRLWHAARRLRQDEGQALIEFALSSLVFFMLTLGVIESGRLIFAYNMVTNSVRDGARWASVRGSASGHAATASAIQSYVAGRSQGQLQATNVTVTWSPNNNPGGAVNVSASRSFTSIVPLVRLRGITLTSATSMIVNQ